MAPIDEPTLGEVLRRIDGLTTQVTALVAEIKQDRVDAARTYVRQDVYLAEKNMQAAVVADLNGDLATLRTDHDRKITGLKEDHGREIKQLKTERQADLDKRRQLVLAVIGLAITLVLGVAALIVNIVR